jgi:hypothetical protein
MKQRRSNAQRRLVEDRAAITIQCHSVSLRNRYFFGQMKSLFEADAKQQLEGIEELEAQIALQKVR